ncbi:MAG: NADH-quinone oxidoreductase subunit J [Candidatus Eisenbacteria bacterium]|uniref:NADH-quinone oxidoreductase subunit J n=1 Tax=Eiseniibacteriota bacterium TaxID=2212470 RepID=A0A948RU98_UNCEI|nr:NADH-quinone oxidoreductase subunit J [Candidatus Eisenbacteria bacterium]MBU1949244.1 NADH-quinone oxidoreductase subunit J [Candidatus Eisenbacteria bacterium]MBU2689582.1 NADH-quinone oxidoreductase subunit J [Candidatus Eisenbacteria bacterium]
MELRDIIFLVFGLLAVFSGIVVAFTPRIIHAVFSLLVTFCGVAGLYVLLQADFIAGAQIMVYVGGILVLLLFGVMLTQRIGKIDMKGAAVQRLPAAILCAALLAILLVMIYATPWSVVEEKVWTPTAPELGKQIMTDYLLPFEVVSILLLGVLMGAALLARTEKES